MYVVKTLFLGELGRVHNNMTPAVPFYFVFLHCEGLLFTRCYFQEEEERKMMSPRCGPLTVPPSHSPCLCQHMEDTMPLCPPSCQGIMIVCPTHHIRGTVLINHQVCYKMQDVNMRDHCCHGQYLLGVLAGDVCADATEECVTHCFSVCRCNLAVMLLTDLIVDCEVVDWTAHLPLMLHIIFLGLDNARPLIHEHCKKLLTNLLLVLAAHNDHYGIARVILGSRGIHDAAMLSVPPTQPPSQLSFMGEFVFHSAIPSPVRQDTLMKQVETNSSFFLASVLLMLLVVCSHFAPMYKLPYVWCDREQQQQWL